MDGRGRLAEPLTDRRQRVRRPARAGVSRAPGWRSALGRTRFARVCDAGSGRADLAVPSRRDRCRAAFGWRARLRCSSAARLRRGARRPSAGHRATARRARRRRQRGRLPHRLDRARRSTSRSRARRSSAIAGVTGRSSLLFLDADEARARLKANPWIADATVLKLYPDRLHITVKRARGLRALAEGRQGRR